MGVRWPSWHWDAAQGAATLGSRGGAGWRESARERRGQAVGAELPRGREPH